MTPRGGRGKKPRSETIAINAADALQVNLNMVARTFTLTVLPADQAIVSWAAPAQNTAGQSFDGTSNDRKIAKYRVYYGTNSTAVQEKTSSYVEVNGVASSPYSPPATSVVISSLTSGTWYFRVTAFDADGDESDVSNPAGSKVIN